MIADGELGDLRVVQVEYAQDWLTERIETTGQKQAEWRTDPKQAGRRRQHRRHRHPCLQHRLLRHRAEARFSLLADLTTFVQGRRVDDNDNILLRFKGGAKGMLWASQVAPGNENALILRVYGSKGGLDWLQENPNYLRFSPTESRRS